MNQSALCAILASLFILFYFDSASQNATLSGVITDSKTKQSLPGAAVVIAGTQLGTSADFDGNFSLKNIPPGKYAIVVSFIGYNTDTIKNIVFTTGESKKMNFTLKESAINIQEFVVTETKVTNTESAVIKEVMESKQIVNAISSEMIKRTQDSDASEVVKRVPGVTIVGNNFIMIRGLSERYNSVMLHDVFAPSMETDVKSFAFDIIPSGMIDRILIYKSPAPDITGEFAGGVVKIYTKSIPDSGFTSVSFSTTYRNGSSMQSFLQPKRSAMHWTGFNDGYNDLPAGFPYDLRRVDRKDTTRLNELGRALNNNWVPEEVNATLDKSFSVTHASKFALKKTEVGNITALTYNNARSIFDVERNDYNAFDTLNNKSQFIYKFNDRQYNHNIRTGILHNWAFRFSPNHILEFKNMFNVFSTTQYINRTGRDFEFNYSPDNHSFDQVYRGIYSTQLMGSHYFNNDRTKINWTLGYGSSYREQPDYRRYRSEIDTNSFEKQLFIGIPLSPNYLGRFFSNMKEKSQSVSVRFEHKLANESFQPVFKTGIFGERKSRSFTARNIGYVRSNFLYFDENLLYTTIDSLFLPENINSTSGIKIGEASNPSDSYDASNLLMAGYAGVELPIGKRIVLNTGLRVENNVQQLNSNSFTNEPIVVDNPILSLLPSANFSYFFVPDKTLIRLAYGKSVNRPEFRELAPFGFYDFNFNLVKKGSDSLRTPSIHNYDLRFETYPNPGEMISFAVFYKRFIDPIETLFVPGGGSGGIKTFTYGNAKMAESMGLELEARKSLSGLLKSGLLDNFSLMFNASVIRSKVELGLKQLGQSNERPLQGQSPYIVNAGIFYTNAKYNFQINALYNVIGERIFIIGFDFYPDIYQMPRNIIDINFSKQFAKRWECKIAFGDVLNQEVLLLQDANKNKQFERESDQIIQRYKPGMTTSIGLGFKF